MSGSGKRQRADRLMVERQLASSRALAQSLIMAGRLFSGERRIDKAGTLLATDAPLQLVAGPRFVSRGGDKLDDALGGFEAHGLTVAGKTCLDVGAATGGFTDCLLQRGAAHVHAVDVGHGQLHPRLRGDPRVVARERTNARYLTAADFDATIELVVVDASFIGIGKLLGAIGSILGGGGELVALIKPQFEVGKRVASRARGVIRDAAERQRAIDAAVRDIAAAGFEVVAQRDSAVRGPKGNVEHFVYARRGGEEKR